MNTGKYTNLKQLNIKTVIIFIFIFTFQIQSGHSQDSLKNGYNSRIRVVKNDPDNSDVKLFRCINNNRSGFLNSVLTITDYSVLPVAIVLPGTLFAYSRAKNRTYDENSAVLIACSEAVSTTITLGIKYLVKRPRPYKTLSNVHLNKGLLGDPYSFPSGHTTIAYSIATSLVLRYPEYPQIYMPAYVYGLIVGYGRIYFGMHYPIDVLGGAVLGSLSAIGVYSLRNEIFKFKNRVFGENKPDENNHNSKSIGFISASYVSALIAGELLSSKKIEIYPSVNSNTEFNCSLRISF